MSTIDRLYSPPEIGAPGKREARRLRRDLRLAGVFFVTMLALAVLGLVLLSPTLVGSYRLYAYFETAEGLIPGIEIRQAGYPIGLVDAVTPLLPETAETASPCSALCFRATLRIRRDWPIPTDSVASIGSIGLLHGDAVLIEAGSASTVLTAESTIVVAPREPTLVARLDALAVRFYVLLDESLAPALAEFQRVLAENMTPALAEFQRMLAENMTPALAALRTQLEQLGELTASTREVISDEFAQTAQAVHALADELRQLLAENRPALRQTVDDSEYSMRELAATLVPILTNLEETTRNLAALSRELRQHPASLLRGRDSREQAPWFQD